MRRLAFALIVGLALAPASVDAAKKPCTRTMVDSGDIRFAADPAGAVQALNRLLEPGRDTL